jgi:hypothetical protein
MKKIKERGDKKIRQILKGLEHRKPQVTHWGLRSFRATETLCGKADGSMGYFSEYGCLTTNETYVTCKHCLELLMKKTA